jgi:hypothetical protein
MGIANTIISLVLSHYDTDRSSGRGLIAENELEAKVNNILFDAFLAGREASRKEEELLSQFTRWLGESNGV